MKLATISLRLSLLMLMTILTTQTSFGLDDWPNWRGPNHNDISNETGLLKSWPKGGPEQVWVNDNAGIGYAGFAVVEDKMYTLGTFDGEEFALCLNSQTGKEIWRQKLDDRNRGKLTSRWGDGSRSTPSVNGNHVYFMCAGGALACLKTESGDVVWQVTMQEFGGAVPVWGYAESPLVDEGRVICTPGGEQGTILALDKMTGEKIWQTKALGPADAPTPAHYASIIPVSYNNQRQYIQLTKDAVVGVGAKDGEVLWESAWRGRTAVIPSPIFSNGQVYVTSGYGIGSKLVQIKPDNSVEELWFSKDMQNHHGGVVMIGDYIYGSSDKKGWICQDKKTGETKWREKRITKGAVSFADGRFYHVQESDGTVLLLEADENKGSVKGKFKLSPQTKVDRGQGKIWVHPVVANGKLYLRDQDMIYCYDIQSP